MFRGHLLRELVECLKERGAFLWHACQYRDLCSYVSIGGVPSRSLLERRAMLFTKFSTDNRDRKNGVWDKVFTNLSDFGWTFARGGGATPNAYGPIMLRIEPDVLLAASDVAICLRSAGAKGFDRVRESLGTIADVDCLFVNARHQADTMRYYLKRSSELHDRWPNARAPEISCSVETGYLPLRHFHLTIDPYVFNDVPLIDTVRKHMSGTPATISPRRVKSPYQIMYQELAHFILSGERSIEAIRSSGCHKSDGLIRWLDKCNENAAYQFRRYCDYLYAGTICPLLDQEAECKEEASSCDWDFAWDYEYDDDGTLSEDDVDEEDECYGDVNERSLYDDDFGGMFEVGSDDPPESDDRDHEVGDYDEDS